jgi:hypothetical protein
MKNKGLYEIEIRYFPNQEKREKFCRIRRYITEEEPTLSLLKMHIFEFENAWRQLQDYKENNIDQFIPTMGEG